MINTWIELTDENQIEQIAGNSFEKPCVIFKHSVSCGISLHIMHKLENNWDFDNDDLNFYYLDLLAHRNISNKIAEYFGVLHQSPQILIIKNGKAISHFSHQAISIDQIKKHL